MQNVEQHVADLERILEALAGTIKANHVGRGVRRKLMKAQQAVDRASGILASLVEDEAPEKPKAKAPAKKKA